MLIVVNILKEKYKRVCLPNENENFIQIHKSYAVNLHAVIKIAANCVELVDGSILPIGNSFKSN